MTQTATQPAYRIETKRLLLRCLGPEDAPAVRAAIDRSDEHLRPWIPFMQEEPRSLLETANWICEHRARFDLNEYFRYGVFNAESGDLVGENMLLNRVGPNALEIGYLTYVGHGGLGYANEATCAMIRVGFEIHDVERLEIHCAPENAASLAIPQRLGFTHEATLRNRVNDTDGVTRDLMVWSMLDGEYPGSAASNTSIVAYDRIGEVILQG